MVTFEENQGSAEDVSFDRTPFMERIKKIRMSTVKTIQKVRQIDVNNKKKFLLQQKMSPRSVPTPVATISQDNDESLLVAPHASAEGGDSFPIDQNSIRNELARVEEDLERVVTDFQDLARSDKSVSFLDQERDISQILPHSSGSSESNQPSNLDDDEEFSIQADEEINNEEIDDGDDDNSMDTKPASVPVSTIEKTIATSVSEGDTISKSQVSDSVSLPIPVSKSPVLSTVSSVVSQLSKPTIQNGIISRISKINSGPSKPIPVSKSTLNHSPNTPKKSSSRKSHGIRTPSTASSAGSHGNTPPSGGSGGGYGGGSPYSAPGGGGGGFGPAGIVAGGRPVFVRSLNIWSQSGLNIRDPTFAKSLASHSKFDTSQDGNSLYDLNANRYKAIMLLLDQKSCACALHVILMVQTSSGVKYIIHSAPDISHDEMINTRDNLLWCW